MKRLIPFLSLLLLISCDNSEVWSKEELYFKAIKLEPDLEFILPKDIGSGISCTDYAEGCVRGMQIKARLVVFTVVEFDTMKQAMSEAKRLDQFYSRNWLFDEVKNEPVIEDLIMRAFDAKRGVEK